MPFSTPTFATGALSDVPLFPLAEYWWFYIAFTGFVLVILALDLGVFHRKAHAVSIPEASLWSVIWVALALGFNFAFYHYCLGAFAGNERLAAIPGFDPTAAAGRASLEFLTGYIVEKALAVDNIFVFVVVFNYFAIPAQYQHRVLFFGIIGALIFRLLFIALGSILLQWSWVVWLAGLFLIFTGIKIAVAPEKPLDPEKNPVLGLLRRFVPVHPKVEGDRFFVKLNAVRYATPLFVALVFIEVSDIIFAIDSVPAIFAITGEPMIVFTSNVFAILGLRAMYFLLAGVVHKFRYLKYGLAVVLVFVGLKMVWLNDAFGGKFPIEWSLGFITLVIGASIAASLLIPAKASDGAAHGH